MFRQWNKSEELLNSSVSAMGKWRKVADSGVSAMGKCEELLNSGVSAMGKWRKVAEQWCFSNGENGCFSNGENGENC
jgi:hypothetical protein